MSQRFAVTPATRYPNSEGGKFSADTSLTVVSCPSCHMTYAIPSSFQASAHKHSGTGPDAWSVCCPLGHQWHYTGPTTEEKLRDQLKRARDRAAQQASRAEQAEASARAQKAAKTRIKNQRDRERQRIGRGACPCCNRHFADVERHMANKHPDHHVITED